MPQPFRGAGIPATARWGGVNRPVQAAGGRRSASAHAGLAPEAVRTLPCRSFPPTFHSGATMKADIHPKYHPVVFQDVTTDFSFLTRSTMSSKEKIKWEDGQEYPLIKVDISSASHPFYTGKHKIVDTGGRVDKFNRRYAAKK